MDTNRRSSRPADRYYDLRTWLEALNGLKSLDVADILEPVYPALSNALVLETYASTYRESHGGEAQTLVGNLAADAGEYNDAITRAVAAAFTSSNEQREAVTALFTQAASSSRETAWRLFKGQAPSIVEQLSRYHDHLIETVKANTIDPNLTTFELATRARVGDKWIALEQAHHEWSTIHALVESWLINGVLPHTGERPLNSYMPLEFRFRNRAAAIAVNGDAHHAKAFWLMRAVEVGDPVFLTSTADVDALPKTEQVDDPPTATSSLRRSQQERQRQAQVDAVVIDHQPKPVRLH